MSDNIYKIDFPCDVCRIIQHLAEEGYDSYAVGGCIRDLILGCTPHDWDITTSAKPEDVIRIFGEGDISVIGTAGIRHGTVMLKGTDGVYEVTTFRKDGEYNDHRRPDSVIFSERIEDDLARRDFTMNAIAAKPCGKDAVVIDPYGGIDDINAKLIRTVGVPVDRFEEDALRVLRALRFASVLGFDIEEDTASAIFEKYFTLRYVAFERISEELWKFLHGNNASDVAACFADVFGWITEGGLSDRFLKYVGETSDPYVRLALMLDHGSSPSAFFDRMRFSGKTVKSVRDLLSIESAPETVSDVCQMMRKFGEAFHTVAEYLRILKKGGTIDSGIVGEELVRVRNKVIEDNVPYMLSHLDVRGGDLISAGVIPVSVGSALESLLDMVQKGSIPNEKTALTAAVANEKTN